MVRLDGIGQIAITVRNVPRAVAFYRDTLGMTESAQLDNSASIIYYKVADITATFEELTRVGVEFVSPPRLVAPMPDHDLWMAFFRDPDQNVLALMCEVRRPTEATP